MVWKEFYYDIFLSNLTKNLKNFLFTKLQYFVVAEFLPYVFQILSLLIDHHPEGKVADTYMALFPHLMAPALWERPGNIPPLVRLLQAYIEKGGKQIETEKVVSINSYINTSKHSFVLQVFASLYWWFFLNKWIFIWDIALPFKHNQVLVCLTLVYMYIYINFSEWITWDIPETYSLQDKWSWRILSP